MSEPGCKPTRVRLQSPCPLLCLPVVYITRIGNKIYWAMNVFNFLLWIVSFFTVMQILNHFVAMKISNHSFLKEGAWAWKDDGHFNCLIEGLLGRRHGLRKGTEDRKLQV